VEALGLDTAAPWLLGTVRNDTLSDSTRTTALKALGNLDDEDLLKQAVEIALETGDRRLRREALQWQEQSAGSLQTLKESLENGDLSEKQAAIASLARDTSREAMALVDALTDQMTNGALDQGLQLDLLELIESKGSPELQAKAKAYTDKLVQQSPFKEFAVTLAGGDAEAGRRIFFEREEVACMRCHKVDGNGGDVGPALNGLVTKQSIHYILESILYPNNAIAEGYESVLIETKDDNFYAGVIKEEDGDKIILNSPEDGILTLKKSNIASREKGLSGMPEGLYLMLSKRELRDLVAFLGSLK
jgi:quinoprotein glucose dehydrogenase